MKPTLKGISFEELRSSNIQRDRVWDPDKRITAAFRATELAGELGEVCNLVKKLERERIGLRGSRASVDDLATELADVMICLDLLALHYGVNLAEATVAKFNATSQKLGLPVLLGTEPVEEGAAP